MDQQTLVAIAVALGLIAATLIVVLRRWHRTGMVRDDGHAPAETGLIAGLTKTRAGFWDRLKNGFVRESAASERLSQFEEILLGADVGVATTTALLQKMRRTLEKGGDLAEFRGALRQELLAILAAEESPRMALHKPHVILVAGVNGVGKTTTIGKLAHRFRANGQKVLLVAADTFRAAAGEQLEVWAARVGAECVRHQAGGDPSAVVFDGMAAAQARDVDVVIVDTAGRLHVKQHLIEELKKIVRVMGRQIAGAPHEVLLVVDATTGQNALAQARVFQEALQVTGVVLTKLDGTAKGGVIFAIKAELGTPVRYVGFGERMEDLQPFDAEGFIDALLS